MKIKTHFVINSSALLLFRRRHRSLLRLHSSLLILLCYIIHVCILLSVSIFVRK